MATHHFQARTTTASPKFGLADALNQPVLEQIYGHGMGVETPYYQGWIHEGVQQDHLLGGASDLGAVASSKPVIPARYSDQSSTAKPARKRHATHPHPPAPTHTATGDLLSAQ